MEISYNNIIYNFDREDGLNNKVFYEKCWFIAKQEPKDMDDFLGAERNAGLYININFFGCKYNNDLEIKIKNLMKTLTIK